MARKDYTPEQAMGDGIQARIAAWTTARREKSAFSSMDLLSDVRDIRALGDAAAPTRFTMPDFTAFAGLAFADSPRSRCRPTS
jgi:hypothetical protein